MRKYTKHYVYLLQHQYNGMNYIGVRFRAKFVGKELTKGPLQGYKFGRIVNGS
jgi:predicted GIY-YIG superfamily endonuclease